MSVSTTFRLGFVSQPTAHVAWVASLVVGLLLFLVWLPGMWQLLRARRTSYGLGITLVLPFLASVSIVVAMDAGYRTHIGDTEAQVRGIEYGQFLGAHHPFHIDRYFSIQQKLGSNSKVAGTVPIARVPVVWRLVGFGRTFSASVVGVPPDITSAVGSGSGGRSGARAMLRRWTAAIRALKPGHGYVNAPLAKEQHLRVGEFLYARAPGHSFFVTVQGVLPEGGIAGPTPSVILPLSAVQAHLSLGDRINTIQVVFLAAGSQERRAVQSFVRSSATSLPDARLSPQIWGFATGVREQVSGKFDEWMVVAALGIAIVTALAVAGASRRHRS